MSIKRMALIASVAMVLMVYGIYSQTVPARPKSFAPTNVKHTVYSGADLGYMVTGKSGGKIEGVFVIRVDNNWVALPGNEPTVKPLQTR